MRTNYVTAPSCELDGNSDGLCDGWSSGGSALGGTVTYERSSTSPVVGSYVQRFAYTAVAGDSSDNSYINSAATGAGTFAEGDDAYASAYIRGTLTGVVVYIGIVYLQSGGAYISQTNSASLSLTGDMQRFSVQGVCPANTGQARLQVYVGGIADGDSFDVSFDAALLEKTDTLADYFDGSTTDTEQWVYAWTGTANASTSTATEQEPAPPSWSGLTVIRDVSS